MTCVLVHGNPETDVIWDPLVRALAAQGVADVVRLSPPGFGAPLPADLDLEQVRIVQFQRQGLNLSEFIGFAHARMNANAHNDTMAQWQTLLDLTAPRAYYLNTSLPPVVATWSRAARD